MTKLIFIGLFCRQFHAHLFPISINCPLSPHPRHYSFLSQIHDFGLFCDSFRLATPLG